jgi:hypothetical protein
MRVNAGQRVNPTLQPLLIALDNSERVDALVKFCYLLINELRSQNNRVNAMASTVAEIKAELTQIEEYIKKWIPGHQIAVNHFLANPPAVIDEVHQKVLSLFDQIQAEASKSAVFAPPVVEAAPPVEEAPHV